ncbi:hypothetical protein AB832_02610 [Flavobacteriaceae bacterium (ex Bugula neritina AB1)]|nr:hypothetical protein AB832_02610 [Flavobacteriaceae bacterium (ex Bugula neritina AB1)]
MEDIRFYKINDEYGDFSNFAPFSIFLEGNSWPTVEHYFQSCKFEDPAIKEKIKSFSSPMKAAKEGRNRKNTLRADWEIVKDNIMLRSLRVKFKQHPNLRKKLLLTDNVKIIEHTKNDSYWGDGGNGNGKNMLGSLLMKVRDELRIINNDPNIVLPPWIAFPEIDQHDMFWRMGLGENYISTWSRYYLSMENKSDYHKTFPEPENWKDFFE